MFSVSKEQFGQTEAYRLINFNTQESALVVPALGGIVNELKLKIGQELISLIDGYKNDSDFDDNLMSTFKGSILFPYPNRTRDGKYSFEGEKHQFLINFKQENNSIHGLVINQAFEVASTESDAKRAKIVLKYSSEWDEGFPFYYELTVVYIFNENGLLLEVETENHGNENFPFGLGWHHYFGFGGKINNQFLRFPTGKELEVDEQMIPTGVFNAYGQFDELRKIDNQKFDTCFELNSKQQTELILSKDEENQFVISYNGAEFPFFQVYTPENRDWIALEPMTCAPNALNNGKGLQILKPRERRIFRVNYGKRFVPKTLD